MGADAALVESQGLEVNITDTSPRYLVDESPDSETRSFINTLGQGCGRADAELYADDVVESSGMTDRRIEIDAAIPHKKSGVRGIHTA